MGDVVIIDTTVWTIEDEEVDVDLYMLDQGRGAGLLVFDVYANGHSFATRYRNEFADDILDFGLESLISEL